MPNPPRNRVRPASDASIGTLERLARVMDQCGPVIDAAAREVAHSRAILASSSQQTHALSTDAAAAAARIRRA